MKFILANALSFICLIAMIAVSLFMYPSLPDTLPTQYGFNGEASNYWPKLGVILIMPIAYAASILAINLMVGFSPDKFSMPNSKRAIDITIFGMGLVMLSSHLGLLVSGGDANSVYQYLSVGMALFLIVTGNVFGKTERNFIIGIRLPWTIASFENWRATHRFAGRLMVAGGVLLLISGYYSPSLIFMLIFSISPFVLAGIYSFFYYLRNERSASEKIQIKP